jgi:two-component system phosphate regulon sensor histidine kinase PhoR
VTDRTRQSRWLIFLLLPATVVAVIVLLGVTLRNSLQLEELREKSIVEATYALASDNADRLDQKIIEQDNAVRTTVDIAEREQFGANWLAVAAHQTPTVRAVLLVDLTSPGADVVAIASRGRQSEDEDFRRLFVRKVMPELRLDEPRAQLRHLHGTYRGQDYLISYWQREHRGRRYLVVAWHYVPLIVHDLFTTLYPSRDQQSRLNVVDAEGRIVFGPPLARGGVTIGRPFETTLYKWWLNATILSAEELGSAVARRRMLEFFMVALSLAVVIAGLLIVALAAVRERRLGELKSDFVANVSHELKTPLSVVRMFGEMLASGRVDNEEKRQQYLQIINTESERLSELIDNLLDFARAERGRSSYAFAEADLSLVVSRTVQACRPRAKGVELVFEPPDPPLELVRLDERAVSIAVANLIDNALKYAPEGRRVVIAIRSRGPAHEIAVTDEGPGIPVEERKRIFERFVRGKAAEETRARGSGIGLALVKHIAAAHGGRAWVEPASPQGSTFVFSIRAGRVSLSPNGALPA